jgi:hypothetical protein
MQAVHCHIQDSTAKTWILFLFYFIISNFQLYSCVHFRIAIRVRPCFPIVLCIIARNYVPKFAIRALGTELRAMITIVYGSILRPSSNNWASYRRLKWQIAALFL